MLLHQMVDQAALRRPEAPDARCGDETLTYEELARRANGLARLLLDSGLQRRDRVAVLLDKGLKVPVAFYGVLASGASLVPIDPRSPVATVARIVRSTGATHIVSEPAKRQTVLEAVAESPSVAHVVGLQSTGEESLPLHGWQAVGELATDRQPEVGVMELDPSYILHTSGSTGVPKLIQHTHRSAMSFLDWAVAEYSLTGEDRLSNHSSHHTCFATFDYYAAARAGAATVILTPAVMMMPGSLSSLLERERVSVWYSVPTALVQLSLRGELEARDLDAVRWVLFAGETFPEKHLRRLMKQLPRARFSHVYGSTEVNVCAYFHLPKASDLEFPLPIGGACPNSALEVVDADLEPVSTGEVGELLVRGSTVMSGYWEDPERNREVLVRRAAVGQLEEVYFRTGDRVRMRDDGHLTFVARADLQVKVRGHRVEL
jgi:amino acid adenylation domain-containing protein